MIKKLRKNLLIFFQLIVLGYLAVLIFLYFNQRNLMYHPNENNYSDDQLLVNIDKVKILTEDNIELLGWFHEKDLKNYKTILYFHGNAGSLENRYFAGVILETPFTSMVDAAKKFYPYIPVDILLKDKFDNKKKIKNINSSILIMHGEADQIVPFSMGKKIFEIANKPKFSYFTKYDDHMMEYDENLIKVLNSFFKSLN